MHCVSKPEKLEIYLLDIEQINEHSMAVLEEYRKRRQIPWQQYLHEEDWQRYLLSHTIVELIGRYKGYWGANIEIRKNSFGKPYVYGASTYYNISHSGRYIVFAYDKNQIGIDLEKISSWAPEVMQSCYTQGEIAYVSSADGEVRDRRFIEVWTRKESYLKCLGTGICEEMNEIDTLAKKVRLPDGKACYIQTMHREEYVISICGNGGEYRLRLVELQECVKQASIFLNFLEN